MIYINKQLEGQTEAAISEKNFPWLFKETENGFVKEKDCVCKVVGKNIYVQTLCTPDISESITKELLRYENELYDRLNSLIEQIDLTYKQLGIVERCLNNEVLKNENRVLPE